MSHDPSGPGLFPEARLDDDEGPGPHWRRSGVGTAGAPLGDLVAMARNCWGFRAHPGTNICRRCGRSKKEHKP